MTRFNFTAQPFSRQVAYSRKNCTNRWDRRGERCENPAHVPGRYWGDRAAPRLDAIELATAIVISPGAAYRPRGCGGLWWTATDLAERQISGELDGLSAVAVARLLNVEGRYRRRLPYRGLEALRQLDALDGTGVEVWLGALPTPTALHRVPVRLRDVFVVDPHRLGERAVRRTDLRPRLLPVGIEP